MWKIAQAVTVCDSELFVLSAPPAGPRCPNGGLRLSSQEHLLTILLAQQHMAVSSDPRLVSCRYRVFLAWSLEMVNRPFTVPA